MVGGAARCAALTEHRNDSRQEMAVGIAFARSDSRLASGKSTAAHAAAVLVARGPDGRSAAGEVRNRVSGRPAIGQAARLPLAGGCDDQEVLACFDLAFDDAGCPSGPQLDLAEMAPHPVDELSVAQRDSYGQVRGMVSDHRLVNGICHLLAGTDRYMAGTGVTSARISLLASRAERVVSARS